MLGYLIVSVGIAILIGMTSYCAVIDVVSRRIPNAATYSLAIGGLAFSSIMSLAVNGLTEAPLSSSLLGSIQGLLTSFAIMFVIYAYTNSGAGDVKLAAGIGSFLGMKGGLLTICYAYITAACFAGCLVIWMFGFGFAVRAVLRLPRLWVTPECPEIEARAKTIMSKGLPLAPFFLIGTLLTLFDLLRFFQAN